MRPADGVDTLRDYVYSVEEIYPYRGSLWLLYRRMRKRGVYISIDGHGGDEILAGYHHYPLVAMLDVARQHSGLAPIRSLKRLHRSLFVDPTMANVRGLRNLLHGFRPDSAFHFATAHLKVTPTPAYFPEYAEDAMALQNSSQLTRNLYFDFHFALLPTILRNFDRVSMAHGVEIRAPFLDYALVSFCMSLPNEYKVSDQYTKQLMRSSMRPLLPAPVCDRKDKVGFLEPFTPWLKEGFGKIMLDVATSQSFLQSNIWEGKTVSTRIERAWKEEQWGALSYYWPFVQAQILVDIFSEKRRAHLLPN
jgi:asparagine synthase (glutamine-hydrolysing)